MPITTPRRMDAAPAQHSTKPVALALRGSIPGKALAPIPCDVGWMSPLAVAIHPHHRSEILKTPHAEPLLCDPFCLTRLSPCLCFVELSSSKYTPAVEMPTTLHGDGSGFAALVETHILPTHHGSLGPNMFATCALARTLASPPAS